MTRCLKIKEIGWRAR